MALKKPKNVVVMMVVIVVVVMIVVIVVVVVMVVIVAVAMMMVVILVVVMMVVIVVVVIISIPAYINARTMQLPRFEENCSQNSITYNTRTSARKFSKYMFSLFDDSVLIFIAIHDAF